MKVLVFGNSGSGKSTHSKALAARYDMAHLDLDSIVWEPGKIAIRRSEEAVAGSLENFLQSHEAWVIEGCYGDLVGAVCRYCDNLVFLNPGLEACLANNLRRPWEPHKYASLEQQNSMLENLQKWVADYYQRADAYSYAAHRRIYDRFAGTKIEYTDVSAYAL